MKNRNNNQFNENRFEKKEGQGQCGNGRCSEKKGCHCGGRPEKKEGQNKWADQQKKHEDYNKSQGSQEAYKKNNYPYEKNKNKPGRGEDDCF